MIRIGTRTIGPGWPCFIIAEAGVNHNGDVARAKELIDVAAASGADAVKFQSFHTDLVISAGAPKAKYQLEATDPGESQADMVRPLELSEAAHRELFEHAGRRGITFLSTPFDEPSADLLDDLGVPLFKIASGEAVNLPFLEYVARKGRPIVLSTGMCDLGEVDAAIRVLRRAGLEEIVLLHCVSNYPAVAADVNLRAMKTMAEAFAVPVGYSDHTLGLEVALAAVALGACVVEKHITVDRNLPGPDHRSSLEPSELAALVAGIRKVESALGHGRKEPAESERDTAAAARRSLVAARDLSAGTRLTADALVLRRPGTGLPPSMRPSVVGRTVRVDVAAGTMLSLDMLA